METLKPENGEVVNQKPENGKIVNQKPGMIGDITKPSMAVTNLPSQNRSPRSTGLPTPKRKQLSPYGETQVA